MMGLVVNKLLLAYKNKPGFLDSLVLNSQPSLLSILNNIRKEAIEKGYATPEQMTKNKEGYIQSRKEKGVETFGNIITQYGFGSTTKAGLPHKFESPVVSTCDITATKRFHTIGLLMSTKKRPKRGVFSQTVGISNWQCKCDPSPPMSYRFRMR